MQLNEDTLQSLTQYVVNATLKYLEDHDLIVKKSNEKSAYAKTESLLYNYNGFKRIVSERMQEIENLRKFGIPKKSKSITQYLGNSGGTPQGLVLEEESVESAVRTVQDSVQGTVQAIALIDKCLDALKNDPYYDILVMRYFEGRTQEDIAITLKCAQQTVSKNKSRLVKELAMRLFPDQVINEYMN